jgi:hypothetical protein
MGRLTQRSAMLALAVTAALAVPALAGPKYWDTDASGGLQGGDGQWDTGSTSNWSPSTAGTAPTAWADNEDAFFQTGGTYAVTVDGTVKANSLSFTSNSVVTLGSASGGGTIQVASGGITAGNGYNQPATINAPLTLDGSQIWQTTGGYSLLTVNGNIGQAAPGAALTFTGTKPANPGTVTLTGTNTYTGGTTINGGLSVKVGSDSALGSGVVHLNGILDTTATSVTLSNDIVVADEVAVSINNNGGAGGSQVFTLNGDLSGSAGSSISLSAGLYNFGGDNSGYSGTINNNQGITLTSLDAGSANAVWAGNNIYGAIKLSSPTGGRCTWVG